MSDKQIFAATEISDHEVRLIVGEFFNTRFNIIKVERIPCDGLSFNKVVNAEAITDALKKAAENTKKMLGADIKKILLAMPSYRLKRYSVRSTVNIDGIDGKITIQDVRNAVEKAESISIGKEYALIQTVCVKYIINGIATRRIPLGEKCDQMSVDIDLLCADRKLSYDLVTCVEKAGLQVLDIFPDIYAVGKEAALFEQSVNKQVVVLKAERYNTTLGLLRKGRLMTAAVMPTGIGTLVQPVVEKYGIPVNTAVELLKYSARLDQKVCSSNPVHIWSAEGKTHTISEQQLVDCVRNDVDLWLNAIQKTCEPILQAGETTVIITGEGGETEGLDHLIRDRLQTEVRYYIPDTLGGRNAGMTAALGLFYAYQDKMPVYGYAEDSLDMDAFEKAVSYRDKTPGSTNKEDTITSKLKGLFLEGKK